LKADIVQLNNVLIENESNQSKMDANVIYKLYELAGENQELKALENIKKQVDRQAYFYGVLVLILYVLAFNNIYQFRKKSGMA
jgi:hypothetical protein